MYVKSIFSDLNESIKKVELEELKKGNVYPATIVLDRYNGCYSNSKWLAFNVDPSSVPEEIGASDPEEMIFWREHNDSKLPIGKGNSPEQALLDLKDKLIVYYENW